MSAHQPEVEPCPTCAGRGWVLTGEYDEWRREHVADPCPTCDGTGTPILEEPCCYPGQPCDDCRYDAWREDQGRWAS